MNEQFTQIGSVNEIQKKTKEACNENDVFTLLTITSAGDYSKLSLRNPAHRLCLSQSLLNIYLWESNFTSSSQSYCIRLNLGKKEMFKILLTIRQRVTFRTEENTFFISMNPHFTPTATYHPK